MQAVDPRSFEVFISYKNSGQDGERTRDAELAFALHEQLQAAGLPAGQVPINVDEATAMVREVLA